MARTDPVFNLRMPSDMKDKITERAKINGRSINAEIIQMLDEVMLRDKILLGDHSEAETDSRILMAKESLMEVIKLLNTEKKPT
ncbi:Arc family DNA-binding protein [Erwinia aphidicola]|uniref:Arc family DNA-binding protein n=1 Tax=Erwinia aphidicola TaxID=68334 RepID=UPI003019505E